jgi:beta-lactamase regulating signal transducer with metallopeptidase domain
MNFVAALTQEVSLMRVFGILADTALKGLVLVAAAAVASYFLRKKSAAARHAVWTAAVLGHLAIPLLGVILPEWRIPIFPAPAWTEAAVGSPATPLADAKAAVITPEASAPAAGVATEGPAATPATGNTAVAPSPEKWPLTAIAGMLWLLGTTLVLLRLAVGTWKVGQLAKHGDRVDDGEWLSLTQRIAKRLGITRPLTLLRGDRLAVPVTWGVVYPAVLLPPDAEEWNDERRRFVLVHEMAHVKRFDALTQLLSQLTVSILWFDPFLWYAAHRMRVEREHACDDYVLREGTTPSLYAGELLEMVQSIGTRPHEHAAPAFAALAMARRSEFEGRMLAILDKRHDRSTLGRGSALAAGIALAAVALPLAALRPFGSVAEAAVNPRVMLTSPVAAAKENTVGLSEVACDSVMRIPVSESNHTRWTHNHVLEDATDNLTIIEHLTYQPGRCVQAIIEGDATIEGDRIVALPTGAHAYVREISRSENRMLRIEPGANGRFEYSGVVNGTPSRYDEEMSAWLDRTVQLALRETAVDARERVARWINRGGVDRALLEIGRIYNSGSQRTHYEALIDAAPGKRELELIRSRAVEGASMRTSDLSTVLRKLDALGATAPRADRAELTRVLRGSETGGDSATVLRQYGASDDPAMILMALQGAAELSSDEDRRVLLTTIAPKALGKRDAVLRKAFFDAAAQFTSDSDLRVLYTSILTHAQSDPEITLGILTGVQKQMTSDEDKRVTLTGVLSQKLLKTEAIRRAFMTAARSIDSDSDFTALMQAALR